MKIITKTDDLKQLCDALSASPYITIDTEFLREKTYFSKLCLVQVANNTTEAIIDPLAKGIDLTPLFDLMRNQNVLKVFHAAYQDLEIFYHMMDGQLPAPVFDTQIGAMVCGLGDNVGYAKLVQHYCNQTLDKGSRFADWSRRPLSEKQLKYALDDVTYLRDVYDQMNADLDKKGRRAWVEEEMETLTNPDTYAIDARGAWQRLKLRGTKPKTLAVLRELAAWRENRAVEKDMPRKHVLNDQILINVASNPPSSIDDLKKIRGVSEGLAQGKIGTQILSAVKAGLSMPKDEWPSLKKRRVIPSTIESTMDILRLALKIRARQHDVVPRMVANDDDLAAIAAGDTDVPAMKGWRYQVFGKDAQGLCDGIEGIAVKDNEIKFIKL